MTTCLVGHTGFVGSNLARQHSFNGLYRSTNISEIDGKSYDLLVCSGVSAAKWRANQAPAEDRAAIDELLTHLSRVKASKVILISTVDVYPITKGVDETYDCGTLPNHAYGMNRLYVEKWMTAQFPDSHVVRLPGLFGPGLKKNVIYDLLHDNCLDLIQPASIFQYYDTANLWNDLETIQRKHIRLINLATEPIATSTILRMCFPNKRVGEMAGPPGSYDIHTIHAEAMGGSGKYRYDATQVLSQLCDFVQAGRRDSAV